MKIHVKFEKPETPREFLKQFFSYPRGSSQMTNVATYKDKNCTVLQCEQDKWRSFDDVLRCVKTYFPEIDEKELVTILLTLDIRNDEGQPMGLVMGDCRDIRKMRMCYSFFTTPNYFSIMHLRKYRSKWSWLQLVNSIGIFSNNQLQELIKNRE